VARGRRDGKDRNGDSDLISQIKDPAVVQKALERYPYDKISLDVDAWLASPLAIALSDEEGNIGLFEECSPHVYSGHYFFKDKGKAAKELSIEMLRWVFDEKAGKVVRGLTPVENRPAAWMARHLGFKSYGDVDTWVGPCTIFIMTKDEFESRHSK
jgi:hypothetical protein